MKKITAILLALCLSLSVCACGGKPVAPQTTPPSEISGETEQPKENRQESPDEPEENIAPEEPEEENTSEEPVEEIIPEPAPNGIRPEVKEFLDSYEEFMDEYIAFMKDIGDDPTSTVALLGDYARLMAEYAEFERKIDEFDTDSLNDTELAYYLEVTTRVEQKLLTAIS